MLPGNNFILQFDVRFILRGAAAYYNGRPVKGKCFAHILGITAFHNYECQA
jgi:hypothetical protein